MPSLLDRTKTDMVLDAYLRLGTSDPEKIRDLVNQTLSRRLSDIKRMLKHLRDIGVIEDPNGEDMVRLLVQHVNPDSPRPSDVFVGEQLLKHLATHGLAVYPFLHAVKAFPNNNAKIQIMTVKNGPTYGFYHLREGDDVSAAMKNFLSYLGFLRKSKKKGVYELTPLGHEILGIDEDSEHEILQRVRCDAGRNGEPCREVCPANAISFDHITPLCVECGLCTVACPYGAITIDCDGTYIMNTEICLRHQGEKQVTPPCSIDLVRGEESILQQWIKSFLTLSDLPSEIPGVGEYPDIVTAKIPSFIEVKKQYLTKKMNRSLLHDQLPRYMQSAIIQKTLYRLQEYKDFVAEAPEFFVLIARKRDEHDVIIQEFLRSAKKLFHRDDMLPVTFLSYESLFHASEAFTKTMNLKLDEFWNDLLESQAWSDASPLLLNHVAQVIQET